MPGPRHHRTVSVSEDFVATDDSRAYRGHLRGCVFAPAFLTWKAVLIMVTIILIDTRIVIAFGLISYNIPVVPNK